MRRRSENMTVGFRLAGKSLSELVRQSEALGVSPGELQPCRRRTAPEARRIASDPRSD